MTCADVAQIDLLLVPISDHMGFQVVFVVAVCLIVSAMASMLFDLLSSFIGSFYVPSDARLRIAAARMRNVHGPALYPGFSRSARHAMIRVLRNRADGVYG